MSQRCKDIQGNLNLVSYDWRALTLTRKIRSRYHPCSFQSSMPKFPQADATHALGGEQKIWLKQETN